MFDNFPNVTCAPGELVRLLSKTKVESFSDEAVTEFDPLTPTGDELDEIVGEREEVSVG